MQLFSFSFFMVSIDRKQNSGMGLSQSEPRFDDAFSDEETSGYTESPTRQSYRTLAASSKYIGHWENVIFGSSIITIFGVYFRSQQPRWRFIRRRILPKRWSPWIRITLHRQRRHGVRANKSPTTTTQSEKSIRLMDVQKVIITILISNVN